MNGNIKIKADKNPLLEYIKDLQEGKIQVPGFQRDFNWTSKQKIELLDSIEKGYPIGSILFWNPNFQKEELHYDFESKRIGSYEIPKKGSNFFYILDGFQRLSTLFGCLINPYKVQLSRNQDEWKAFDIVYNLEAEKGKYNFELNTSNKELVYYKIPVYSLIDPKDFFNFQRKLFQLDLEEEKIEEYLRKFENVSKRFQVFELPVINIYGGTIEEAVDIFQRLNSKGSPMSADWLLSALSFTKDFQLGVEISKLLEKLDSYNFKNLQRQVILQCITNSFGSAHFDMLSKGRKLEELARRKDFREVSRKTLQSIEKTVRFLFEELLVLNSKRAFLKTYCYKHKYLFMNQLSAC